MTETGYPGHEALNPFFEVVMKGLKPFVDGAHYYDTLAEDVVFEFLYRFPGWPEKLTGRDNLIAMYAGYGENIKLHKGDGLAVHHDPAKKIVTLEYQVHGKAIKSGAAYDNRFVSIVTLRDRKIIHWRDYMDSLAAWQTLTGG
jgi:ketosteroid isomerase-like protein